MNQNLVESDQPVAKPLRLAFQYSNGQLIRDAAQKLQMSELAVLELFFELKLYFYLCYFYRERLPAPAHIDTLWHIFLGREEEYAIFCLDCFGGMIEHIPHNIPSETGVTRTIDRAHEKFGSRLATRWQRSTRCDGLFKPAA